jgi:hypothetical protein
MFGPSTAEVGVMNGRSTHVRYGRVSAPGGLGVVWGEPRGLDWTSDPSPGEAFNILGVPLEIQWRFAPWSYLGVGLSGVGDVNPQTSFVGLLLSLHLGRVR